MFVVDTNVSVYAADVRAAKHARCRELLERWRAGSAAWFLTWGICYEFLRVVTHHRVLCNPWTTREAHAFVDTIVESPGLEILVQTERHREVLSDVVRGVPVIAGNLWHDTETAVLMREHGVRHICTHDTDFHRVAFLEPVDPMVAEP
ncbi:MAG: PIN domain-containing protein [Gemmatimonadaceae bacterium]|nr:PIN domain-containing protein [Gemmatimonadaceae bacterium]